MGLTTKIVPFSSFDRLFLLNSLSGRKTACSSQFPTSEHDQTQFKTNQTHLSLTGRLRQLKSSAVAQCGTTTSNVATIRTTSRLRRSAPSAPLEHRVRSFVPVSARLIAPEIRPLLTDSERETFQYEPFSQCTAALAGNFTFGTHQFPPPPRAKWVSGDCRRKLPCLCGETFAVNAAIDLIGPL